MNDIEQVQISNTIFDQLNQTKVNGFPLLKYIGVKAVAGNETTVFLKVTGNPKQILRVGIKYEHDSDTYTISFYKKLGSGLDEPTKDVYADQLGSVITNGMGVN